ncbi:hypothetical protein [Aquabacterium sp.]|uniref:hypothetical protein n=1 Tax=Aquabacterium sp. TaxID=1872578 RepID=UPI0035AF06BB
MQVDALAVELRPRPMMEATDLGARMVQANAASVWRCYTPLLLLATAAALSSIAIADWLPGLLLFWLKPWLDRSLLFVLARAVFGQATRWSDLWSAQRGVWWSRLPSTLSIRRLSPWRAYTQPIYQLEGQAGATQRQRRAQLLQGHRIAATFMHLAFAHIEMALCLGCVALLVWLMPANSHFDLFRWLRHGDDHTSTLAFAAIYAVVMLLLEPFYVAAGFAMYLNRRVELEAWDIEQTFRRAFEAPADAKP